MVKRNLLLFQRMIDECSTMPAYAAVSWATQDLCMIVVPEPDEGKHARTFICANCFWRLVSNGVKMPRGIERIDYPLQSSMTCEVCGKTES